MKSPADECYEPILGEYRTDALLGSSKVSGQELRSTCNHIAVDCQYRLCGAFVCLSAFADIVCTVRNCGWVPYNVSGMASFQYGFGCTVLSACRRPAEEKGRDDLWSGARIFDSDGLHHADYGVKATLTMLFGRVYPFSACRRQWISGTVMEQVGHALLGEQYLLLLTVFQSPTDDMVCGRVLCGQSNWFAISGWAGHENGFLVMTSSGGDLIQRQTLLMDATEDGIPASVRQRPSDAVKKTDDCEALRACHATECRELQDQELCILRTTWAQVPLSFGGIIGCRDLHDVAMWICSLWLVLCLQMLLSHLKLLSAALKLRGGDRNADNLIRFSRGLTGGGALPFVFAYHVGLAAAVQHAVPGSGMQHYVHWQAPTTDHLSDGSSWVENAIPMPPFEPWLPRPDFLDPVGPLVPDPVPNGQWQAVLQVYQIQTRCAFFAQTMSDRATNQQIEEYVRDMIDDDDYDYYIYVVEPKPFGDTIAVLQAPQVTARLQLVPILVDARLAHAGVYMEYLPAACYWSDLCDLLGPDMRPNLEFFVGFNDWPTREDAILTIRPGTLIRVCQAYDTIAVLPSVADAVSIHAQWARNVAEQGLPQEDNGNGCVHLLGMAFRTRCQDWAYLDEHDQCMDVRIRVAALMGLPPTELLITPPRSQIIHFVSRGVPMQSILAADRKTSTGAAIINDDRQLLFVDARQIGFRFSCSWHHRGRVTIDELGAVMGFQVPQDWIFELVGVDRTQAYRGVYQYRHGQVATIVASQHGPMALLPVHGQTAVMGEEGEHDEEEDPTDDPTILLAGTGAHRADRSRSPRRPNVAEPHEEACGRYEQPSCWDEEVDWCRPWEFVSLETPTPPSLPAADRLPVYRKDAMTQDRKDMDYMLLTMLEECRMQGTVSRDALLERVVGLLDGGPKTHIQLAPCIGPQCFDLDLQHVQVQTSFQQLCQLSQPWEDFAAQANFDTLQLHESTIAALTLVSPSDDLRHAAVRQFQLYTDGSEKAGKAAWAVAILAQTDSETFLGGVFGAHMAHETADIFPDLECDALRAEQMGVLWAHLWILQWASTIGCSSDFTIAFDCMAAGMGASGEMQPPGQHPFSRTIRGVAQTLYAVLPDRIHYQHVPGHSGQPWNELVDVAAKLIAKEAPKICLPTPPGYVAKIARTVDWEWAWTEAAAAVSRQFPGRSSTGMEWKRLTTTCSLTPEQLIPTSHGEVSGGNKILELQLKVATVNVQGLGRKKELIEKQMVQFGYDVIFMQETKMSGGSFATGKILKLATDHQKHWGVAVWISKTMLKHLHADELNLDDVHVAKATSRLIAVIVAKGKVRLVLIAAHFPQQGTLPAERTKVLNAFREICEKHGGCDVLLAGVDANARLPPSFAHATGALEFGKHDDAGLEVAEILEATGMTAPSTFMEFHRGDSQTWKHPKGGLSRIDFVFVGGQAATRNTCTWTDFDFDLVQGNDDHWMASLQACFQMKWQRCAKSRPRPTYDRRKMLTPEGRSILRTETARIVLPSWEVDVHTHAQTLQDALQGIMREHFPAEKAGPRAAFITSEVWGQRCKRVKFKKRTRRFRETCQQTLAEIALQRWRGDQARAWLSGKISLLYELFATAVQISADRSRRAVRATKQKLLTDSLRRLEGKSVKDVQAELRKLGIGGRPKRKDLGVLPCLQTCEGQAVVGREQLDELWLRFFNDMELGHICQTSDFIQQTGRYTDDEDVHLNWDMVPSLQEVEEVFRNQALGKASGYDAIPGELLKACPTALARLYQPLYVKASLSICRPLQWRGGLLFECYKGSGGPHTAGNYRSLYVSSVVGKGFHKLLRKRMRETVGCTFHSLQCGAKPGMAVSAPALAVQLMARHAKRVKQAVSFVFLDTATAYYRIARELAVGVITTDRAAVHVFERFGLGPVDLRDMMDIVRRGGILRDSAVPGHLCHLAKDLMRDTWSTTRFGDHQRVSHAQAGSRPGETWADLIFGFVYHRVLQRIREAGQAEQFALELQLDVETGPWKPPRERREFTTATVMSDASWDKFENGYLRLLRRLLAREIDADILFRLSAEELYCRTGQWALETLARQKRLNFLSGLARQDCAALWGIMQLEVEWGQQVREDCEWLVKGTQTKWPLLAADNWKQWSEVFNRSPGWFQRQVKIAAETHHRRMLETGGVKAFFRDLLRHMKARYATQCNGGTETSWVCMPCKKCFRDKSALATHFFRRHHRTAAYRHYAQGHVCGACGKDFFAQYRLQAHLRMTPKCCEALAARGLVATAIGPGEGSRAWREDRHSNFILCPPTQPTQTVEPVACVDRRWNEVAELRRAYLHLSCEVLDYKATEGSSISTVVHQALRGFALYADEVGMALQRILAETIEVCELQEQPWGQHTPFVLAQLRECCASPQHVLMGSGADAGEHGQAVDAGSVNWDDVCATFPSPKASQFVLYIDDNGQGTNDEPARDVVASYHEALQMWDSMRWSGHKVVLTVKGSLEGEELLWTKGSKSSLLAMAGEAPVRQLLLNCWEYASAGGEVVIVATERLWCKEALSPFRSFRPMLASTN